MEKDLGKELEILNAKLDDLRKSSTNENEISFILLEIGSVYFKQGKNDEALKYYNQFIESKKRPKQTSIEEAIDYIGTICFDEGKYELALKYENQSLEIKRQSLPLNHLEIRKNLNNIGLVFRMQGKYEEALKYLNQLIEMKKETLPSNDILIADTIYNIGLVYQDQGKYEEALKYYKQSLEMKKQTLPSNDSRIVNMLYNIIEVYEILVNRHYYQPKNLITQVTHENSDEDIIEKMKKQLLEKLENVRKLVEREKQKEAMENDNEKIEQTELDGQNKQEATDKANQIESQSAESKELQDILSTFEMI